MTPDMKVNLGITVASAVGLGSVVAFASEQNERLKNFSKIVGATTVVGLAIFAAVRLMNYREGQDLACTLKVMRHLTSEVILFLAPMLGTGITGYALNGLLGRHPDEGFRVWPGLVTLVAGGAFMYGVGTQGFRSTISLVGRNFVQYGLAPTLGGALWSTITILAMSNRAR